MEALILAVESKKIRIPGSGGGWFDRWKGRGCAPEAESDQEEPTGPDPAAVQALLGELRTFQWEETAGGKPVPRHPSGGHDDCIQALAMAWKAGGEVRNHVPRAMPALTMVGKRPIAIHRSSFRHPYDDDDPGWWIPEGAVVPYEW